MESLQQLQDIVTNATSATRDRIVEGVMEDGYLAKLLSIFRDCEDLEMTYGLSPPLPATLPVFCCCCCCCGVCLVKY